MNAKHDLARGVIVLTSGGNSQDESLLRRIVDNLPVNQKMPYKGRDTRGNHHQLFFLLGGEKIAIKGHTQEDEKGIRALRDPVYWGGGGLIMLSHRQEAGSLAVEVCVSRCKHCEAPLIQTGRCEWEVCNTCAEKCPHEYVEGAVHGGNAGQLGAGQFCRLCGVGKPEDKPKVIIPHSTAAIAVVA